MSARRAVFFVGVLPAIFAACLEPAYQADRSEPAGSGGSSTTSASGATSTSGSATTSTVSSTGASNATGATSSSSGATTSASSSGGGAGGSGGCAAGYQDCDNDLANGCEAHVATDAANCGVCGKTCGSKQSCIASTCQGGPSCATQGPGLNDCGSGESCCVSELVPGGTFSRRYDGVSTLYTDAQYIATVNAFRLDRYEVTVGRFRRFVDAVTTQPWAPPATSGKHTHLAAGGLNGGGEPGWSNNWNSNLSSMKTEWDTQLHCDGNSPWTSDPGPNENKPVACLSWYVAYAFCIWDAGFLPSEAEWNFAASGGAEQRVYPWSIPATSNDIDMSHAVYGSMTSADVGSKSPLGDGHFGHADLAGNVAEWTLDVYANPLSLPCIDCAVLSGNQNRVVRGGGFAANDVDVIAAKAIAQSPSERLSIRGVRCARSP